LLPSTFNWQILDQVPYLISLLIFIFSCWGDSYQKTQGSVLRRFKSDRDEILHDCSSIAFASSDGVSFRIWRHTFEMAAMTSFREKPLARHVWS